jgi:eukaryotic-like serine/threonine-protein kinase
MTGQVVQEVCYLEESGSDRDIPPGFLVKDMDPTAKPGRLAGWLGRQRGAKRIVYRPTIRLSLDDLEVVSFVPGGGSLGTWCWCDVFLRIEDPLALLGERGQQQTDGRWLVTEEWLAAWYRERLVEALAGIGNDFGLTSPNHWPELQARLVQRMIRDCPEGIVWDAASQRTHPCLLRRVRSYEQYLEEVTLKDEFRLRLEQIQRNGSLLRAAEQGRLDELLSELGEDRVAELLTPAERAGSPGERITSYQQVLGSASGTQLLPGVVIGNFRLLAPLGQGGQGQVWKAHDTKGGRFVVLKLVPPAVQNAASEMARVKETFARTYDLNHQHICPVHLLDHDPRFGWYLVMKYIDGQTLRTYRATYVARHGAFPLAQVVKILRPVAEALDYAHAHKVIHRDIKPENILVVGAGHEVAVVDFGLAAEVHTSLSRITQNQLETSGTRPYMAPEQWRGEYQDRTTDQYSLAVVAYELLAGHLPFDSEDFDILSHCVQNQIPPPIADQPAVVSQTLSKGLAKLRSERYESCVAFVDALEASREPARKAEIAEVQRDVSAVELPARHTPPERSPDTLESTPKPPPGRTRRFLLTSMALMLLVAGLVLCLPHFEELSLFPFGESASRFEPLLAIAPFDAAKARDHQIGWTSYLNAPIEINNSIGMKLVLIPAGEFMMGSPEGDSSRFSDEQPQHLVRITKAYYLGVTEVTQTQYERVMGTNPSKFKGAQLPVEMVPWEDAVEFCRKLSEKEGRTYRLPTEAEWEHACRAGSQTKWSFGDEESRLGEYAWYDSNSYRTTHPVGEKKPNAWGLYDMHGNVWEWCSDWKGEYASIAVDDPTGATAGSLRVFRGGSWYSSAGGCRSAFRLWHTSGSRYYYLGFRVASSSVGASGK